MMQTRVRIHMTPKSSRLQPSGMRFKDDFGGVNTTVVVVDGREDERLE